MMKLINIRYMIALMAIVALSFAFSPVTTKADELLGNGDTALTGRLDVQPPVQVGDTDGEDQPAPVVPEVITNNNGNAAETPTKKRHRSSGGKSVVRKSVAVAPVAVAPVLSMIEVAPPAPVVAVNAVRPTVAVAPVAVAPVAVTPVSVPATAPVAVAPVVAPVDNGLAASASQSFGSKFLGFFSNLWNCVFGSECK